MQILAADWDAVTTETVVNCFQKSRISSESQNVATAEGDDSFKELVEDIENLHSIRPDLVSGNMDAASFTDVNAEVLPV